MLRGMNVERLGRLVRRLRVHHGLTQSELATRSGVSRRAVSLIERGRARELRLAVVERALAALEARADIRVLWHGPELDRLLDELHAALGSRLKRRLERWGWIVRVEVTFSRYGERGRIDLLAYHPATRILAVVELKTDLVAADELLGTLDMKHRLAPQIASGFGWSVDRCVPVIAFLEDRTTRNRLLRVATLFDRYSLRGRAALSWLRAPSVESAPTGLLFMTKVPSSARRRTQKRVRKPRELKPAPDTRQ
ncbi:MAG: helix-turn-helix transcriptional regulator [Acidimicrobiia bacterium]